MHFFISLHPIHSFKIESIFLFLQKIDPHCLLHARFCFILLNVSFPSPSPSLYNNLDDFVSLFSHSCCLTLPFHQSASSTHWGLLEQVACGRLLPRSACRPAGGCLPVCVSVCMHVKVCIWNVSVNACVQTCLCICSVLCQFVLSVCVCVLVCPALIEQRTGEELSQSRWLRKPPARWRFCGCQWLPLIKQGGNIGGGGVAVSLVATADDKDSKVYTLGPWRTVLKILTKWVNLWFWSSQPTSSSIGTRKHNPTVSRGGS